ncbi:hypothetical protein Q8F55_000963 [Vanrija albida]|uniref:GH18 domain-containing protein n=1 Tax=Vanrija albida TaxID=181172 RepID=A0ABR3QES3_9TREE
MILPSILAALLVPIALAAPAPANAPRRLTSLPPGYKWKPHHWPPTAVHPTFNATNATTHGPTKRDCTQGSWGCAGAVLQQCSNNAWVNVATCSSGLVCSATAPNIGCVYPWQVTSAATNPATSTAASTTSKPASSTTTTTPAPTQTVKAGKFSAPHYVIYSDSWLANGLMPTVAQLGGFNRFILAFDMTIGAVDNAALWTTLDDATRTSVLNSYHDAGIALMVSAFGSTDAPTSGGQNPVALAGKIAEFVRKWQLDGVDIDYEEFQIALRNNLGPNYLISHGGSRSAAPLTPAPVAPWFCRSCYKDGAYAAFNEQAGNTVDFYSLQYYNQGTAYTDCNTLVFNSASTSWPYTSIGELHSHAGIPLNKLVIGKPLIPSGANSGYMTPSALGQCVAQGKASLGGWPGSVMFWEWKPEANPAAILKTVTGA